MSNVVKANNQPNVFKSKLNASLEKPIRSKLTSGKYMLPKASSAVIKFDMNSESYVILSEYVKCADNFGGLSHYIIKEDKELTFLIENLTEEEREIVMTVVVEF